MAVRRRLMSAVFFFKEESSELLAEKISACVVSIDKMAHLEEQRAFVAGPSAGVCVNQLALEIWSKYTANSWIHQDGRILTLPFTIHGRVVLGRVCRQLTN